MARAQQGADRTSWTRTLVCAVTAVAVGFGLRFVFDPLVGNAPPFVFFFLPVVTAAFYGGYLAGFSSTILSLAAGWYFFIEPRQALVKGTADDFVRVVTFAVAGVGVTLVASYLRRTQQAAQRSQQRLTLALAAGGLGVWDWDVVRDELTWGDGFNSVHGLPPNAAPRSFTEFLGLIHEEDRQGVEQAVAAAVDRDEPYDVEFRTVWPDGTLHWATRRGVVLRDDTGRAVRMLGVGADITARKKTEAALVESEAQLRRYNEQLEQFAYAVAHDLQEPLRSVSIYSELLMRRLDGRLEPRDREFLGHVHGGAQRMVTLVKDLLRYTTAVEQEADLTPVDCNAAAAQAIGELATLIAATGAEVHVGKLPQVVAFHPHLVQLFQNLIGNGLKYRAAGRVPKIAVTAERREREWVLCVQDNGIGIAPSYHERIFGVFKRLHRHDEIEGNGIGLAITKRIVEHHGGRIWVESEEGCGARFLFTLPDRAETVSLAVRSGN
jgi:signal transduction histidine kinase